MRVKIKEDLRFTEDYFGVVFEMREMKGKTYKVNDCVDDFDTPYYIINGWHFDKRDCEIVDDYMFVDNKTMKYLDGFVIDLSTTEKVYYELENVVHDIEDRVDIYRTMTIEEMREFILEYYATTYQDDYIMWVAPNVYRIIERDLFVKRG